MFKKASGLGWKGEGGEEERREGNQSEDHGEHVKLRLYSALDIALLQHFERLSDTF